MPGEIEYTVVAGKLRTVHVEAQLSAADEDHLLANAGQWADGYVPTTKLGLCSRVPEQADSRPQWIYVTGEGLEGEALDAYKDGVREFFTMPKCHLLVGRIMRGEEGYTDTPGEGGVKGADAWRTRFAGTPYNMHDGAGSFVVTAPEGEGGE